jgi:hypothetical protein
MSGALAARHADSKELEKGRVEKTTVRRYWPGRAPAWLQEQQQQQAGAAADGTNAPAAELAAQVQRTAIAAPVVVKKAADPRLARLAQRGSRERDAAIQEHRQGEGGGCVSPGADVCVCWRCICRGTACCQLLPPPRSHSPAPRQIRAAEVVQRRRRHADSDDDGDGGGGDGDAAAAAAAAEQQQRRRQRQRDDSSSGSSDGEGTAGDGSDGEQQAESEEDEAELQQRRDALRER